MYQPSTHGETTTNAAIIVLLHVSSIHFTTAIANAMPECCAAIVVALSSPCATLHTSCLCTYTHTHTKRHWQVCMRLRVHGADCLIPCHRKSVLSVQETQINFNEKITLPGIKL